MPGGSGALAFRVRIVRVRIASDLGTMVLLTERSISGCTNDQARGCYPPREAAPCPRGHQLELLHSRTSHTPLVPVHPSLDFKR